MVRSDEQSILAYHNRWLRYILRRYDSLTVGCGCCYNIAHWWSILASGSRTNEWRTEKQIVNLIQLFSWNWDRDMHLDPRSINASATASKWTLDLFNCHRRGSLALGCVLSCRPWRIISLKWNCLIKSEVPLGRPDFLSRQDQEYYLCFINSPTWSENFFIHHRSSSTLSSSGFII